MKIFSSILRTFKVSRRESCKLSNRRYSSQVCPRICLRSFATSGSKKPPLDSSEKQSTSIIPVAFLKADRHNADRPLKILVIPINLFGDSEAVQKTLSTISALKNHAEQIDAFTESASDIAKEKHMAADHKDHHSKIQESLWRDIEAEAKQISDVHHREIAEVDSNNTQKAEPIFSDVPEKLQKSLSDAAISSMSLAFEMDMTNIKDALMNHTKASADEIEQSMPPMLEDPTIRIKTDVGSMQEAETIPLSFNALIHGTVNIDSSKITAERLEEIEIPEFNEYVTAIAANICSTALQKGFPADINRMYSTASKEPTAPNPPRNPHIVCVSDGKKGCVSPGNAHLEPFIPKERKEVPNKTDTDAAREPVREQQECSLLTSTIIGDLGARGLMSCHAYARALKEATRLRENAKSAKSDKCGKKDDCPPTKDVCPPCEPMPCGPPKQDSMCKNKNLRDPKDRPTKSDPCTPQERPCNKRADSVVENTSIDVPVDLSPEKVVSEMLAAGKKDDCSKDECPPYVKKPCPSHKDARDKYKVLKEPPKLTTRINKNIPQEGPCNKRADSVVQNTSIDVPVDLSPEKVVIEMLAAPDSDPPCKKSPFICPQPKKQKKKEEVKDNDPCRHMYPDKCPPSTSRGNCKLPIYDPCKEQNKCIQEPKKPDPMKLPCDTSDPCKKADAHDLVSTVLSFTQKDPATKELWLDMCVNTNDSSGFNNDSSVFMAKEKEIKAKANNSAGGSSKSGAGKDACKSDGKSGDDSGAKDDCGAKKQNSAPNCKDKGGEKGQSDAKGKSECKKPADACKDQSVEQILNQFKNSLSKCPGSTKEKSPKCDDKKANQSKSAAEKKCEPSKAAAENKCEQSKAAAEKKKCEPPKPTAEKKSESQKSAADKKCEPPKPTAEKKSESQKSAADKKCEPPKPAAEKKSESQKSATDKKCEPPKPAAEKKSESAKSAVDKKCEPPKPKDGGDKCGPAKGGSSGKKADPCKDKKFEAAKKQDAGKCEDKKVEKPKGSADKQCQSTKGAGDSKTGPRKCTEFTKAEPDKKAQPPKAASDKAESSKGAPEKKCEPPKAAAEKKAEPLKTVPEKKAEPPKAVPAKKAEPPKAVPAKKAEPPKAVAEKKAEPPKAVPEKKAEPPKPAAEKKCEPQKAAAEKKAETQKAAADKKCEPPKATAEKKAETQKAAAEKKCEPQKSAAEKKTETQNAAAEKKCEPQKAAAEKKAETQKAAAEKKCEPLQTAIEKAGLDKCEKPNGQKADKAMSTKKQYEGIMAALGKSTSPNCRVLPKGAGRTEVKAEKLSTQSCNGIDKKNDVKKCTDQSLASLTAALESNFLRSTSLPFISKNSIDQLYRPKSEIFQRRRAPRNCEPETAHSCARALKEKAKDESDSSSLMPISGTKPKCLNNDQPRYFSTILTVAPVSINSVANFFGQKKDDEPPPCPKAAPRPKNRWDVTRESMDCFKQDRLDDPCHKPPPKNVDDTACNRKEQPKKCWEKDDKNKENKFLPCRPSAMLHTARNKICYIQARNLSRCHINMQQGKQTTLEADGNIDENNEAKQSPKLEVPDTQVVTNDIIKIGLPGEILHVSDKIGSLNDHDVLIRMAAIAISGSDIHVYETGSELCQGMTMGHDATGIVEKTGKCVYKLRPGDCVVMEPGLSCGICDVCKAGTYAMCPQLFHNGFFSTFQTHPADMCHKIPKNLTIEDATLTSTLASACQACFKAHVTPAANVLIIGTCAKACAAALCARALGAKSVALLSSKVYTLEMIRILFDLEYVHYYEDETDLLPKITERVSSVLRDRPNVVINYAISESTMNLSTNLLQPSGICVLAECDQEHANINAMDVIMKNISLVPSIRSASMFPTALHLMKTGKTPIGELISRIYSWDQVKWAFHWAQYEANIGNRKVVVQCNENL